MNFLPECDYNLDPTVSMDSLRVALNEQLTVTAYVVKYSAASQSLIVKFGNGIGGKIPLEESTIYSLHKDARISANVSYLVGQTIRAKVLSIDGNTVILSRKANMLDVLSKIKHEKSFVNAVISSMFGHLIFIDVADGIRGIVRPENLTPVRFSSGKFDLGLRVKMRLPVSVLFFNEEIQSFELSHREFIPDIEDELSVGDVLICKVLDKVDSPRDNCYGYFAVVGNAMYSGIIDSPISLPYGPNVLALISRISEKGLHLKFITRCMSKPL